MSSSPSRRRNRAPPSPLDRAGIEALALAYAGRYLTTRARIGDYLRRKLRERGGEDGLGAQIGAIVARMAELGYVDDAGFASARTTGLTRRGYGRHRIGQALRAAGIEADDAAAALDGFDDDAAWAAVLRFARRRRLGPFGDGPSGPDQHRRSFALLLRAGHPPQLAAKLLKMDRSELEHLINAE